MRTWFVVTVVASLFALGGCTSQDVRDRAGNLRTGADAIDATAQRLASLADNAEVYLAAATPLLEQVRVWFPDRAAQIDVLIRSGAEAPVVASLIDAALGDVSARMREQADTLESNASDDAWQNALIIGGGVLATIFGIHIPTPTQRRRVRAADQILEVAARNPGAGVNPIPAPEHPQPGARG